MQTCREFLLVYLSQTDTNCWEAKSQGIEKMLQEIVALPLTLYIRIKEDVRGSHEIHWWQIREAEENKAGKSLGLDKK